MAKSTGTRKTAAKGRKTSARGRGKVGQVMHEFKHGELKTRGRTVRNPKQAIAIALNEAREAGADIPPRKGAKKASKKTAAKKSAAAKKTVKKAAKKTAAKNQRRS